MKAIVQGFFILLFIVGCGDDFAVLVRQDLATNSVPGLCREKSLASRSTPEPAPEVVENKWDVLIDDSRPESGGDKGFGGEELSLTLSLDQACLNQGKGSRLSKPYIQAGLVGQRDYLFKVAYSEVETVKKVAEQDPCINFVSNEISLKSTGYELDPFFSRQKHLKVLGVQKVIDSFDLGRTSESTPVVAVIDSGVDWRHEDLIDSIWQNSDEIPGNGIDDDANGYTDDYHGYDFVENMADPGPKTDQQIHGTHVAGLIGARYGNGVGGSGLMIRGVQLMILNVFGRENQTSSSHVNNAIRYAADNGAQVINLSVGNCGYSAATGQAIAHALKRGVVVVIAAGNDGRRITTKSKHGKNCDKDKEMPIFQTPASFAGRYKGAIAVGSHDSLQPIRKSLFSNYSNSVVQLMATGAEDSSKAIGLLSTVPGGYSRMSGSSMAAPLVSASAALTISLLNEKGFQHEPKSIEHLLVRTGAKNSEIKEYVKNGKVLSLYRLVKKIEKISVEPENEGLGEEVAPIPVCN